MGKVVIKAIEAAFRTNACSDLNISKTINNLKAEAGMLRGQLTDVIKTLKDGGSNDSNNPLTNRNGDRKKTNTINDTNAMLQSGKVANKLEM